MLDVATTRAAAARTGFDVAIASVATANPPHLIRQEDMRARADAYVPQFASLGGVYENAGVRTRYFSEPPEWYYLPRTWEERTAAFQRHAVDLMEEVTVQAVEQAGLRLNEIDAIVTNTITGLSVPSLDALLMNRLAFAPNTERLPIFGFGCGGGVGGLSRATRIAQTMPGGNVLFITVELCSLCLRVNDERVVNYVAGALFGDGAAAMVLRNTAGSGASPGGGRVAAVGDHFWRDTTHIMGWDILGDGFGIVLSAQLPALMEERLAPAVDGFLARNGLSRDEFDGFLLHAGSSKLLDIAEQTLAMPAGALEPSRATLREYGNMSSATILFAVKRAIAEGRKGRHLIAAFGPGFSAYFAVVDF